VQIRSVVVVGAVLSNWTVTLHFVKGEQIASVVLVGGVLWYWSAGHLPMGTQTWSDI